MIVLKRTLYEPVSSKRYKLAYAPIKDTDQTAHLRSLICVFDVHSMGSQGSKKTKYDNDLNLTVHACELVPYVGYQLL